jgi:hypothetical protein
MEMDQICMELNPNITFYLILVWIRAHIDLVEYEYKTNVSENYIRKFTQFNSKYILLKFNVDE